MGFTGCDKAEKTLPRAAVCLMQMDIPLGKGDLNPLGLEGLVNGFVQFMDQPSPERRCFTPAEELKIEGRITE